MRTRRIHVPIEDLRSLESLLRVAATGRQVKDKVHLQALREELTGAKEVTSDRIAPDVVTLNSRVLLRDLNSGEDQECVLVLPERANMDHDRISVVAPIGAAILGRRVGEVVTIRAPAGSRRLRIERMLYQPEAAARVSERSTV